jgi:hypothetical protein
MPDRDVLSGVVIDRRRRQCRDLSRGARLRPHRAHAGSIEIFPAARAIGVNAVETYFRAGNLPASDGRDH